MLFLFLEPYINDNANICFNGHKDLKKESFKCREILLFKLLFIMLTTFTVIVQFIILPTSRTFKNHSYTKESYLSLPVWISYIVFAIIIINNFAFMNEKYPLILSTSNMDIYTNINGINDTFVSKLTPPDTVKVLKSNGCQMITPNLLYNNETLKSLRNTPTFVKLPYWIKNQLQNSNITASKNELKSINSNIFASKTIQSHIYLLFSNKHHYYIIYIIGIEAMVSFFANIHFYADKTFFNYLLRLENDQAEYGIGSYNNEYGNTKMTGKNKEVYIDECLDQLRMLLIDIMYPKCDHNCNQIPNLVCVERCRNLQNVCGDLLNWFEYDKFWNKWTIDGVRLNMTFDNFYTDLLGNQTQLGIPSESIDGTTISVFKSLIAYECNNDDMFSNTNLCIDGVYYIYIYI